MTSEGWQGNPPNRGATPPKQLQWLAKVDSGSRRWPKGPPSAASWDPGPQLSYCSLTRDYKRQATNIIYNRLLIEQLNSPTQNSLHTPPLVPSNPLIACCKKKSTSITFNIFIQTKLMASNYLTRRCLSPSPRYSLQQFSQFLVVIQTSAIRTVDVIPSASMNGHNIALN